ncbi:MAG: hypothetical protein OEY55_02655 [Acidimicrobiia bacterium]|nr:hypothetical protein [Acidimicrobiia bacterium]MDH5420689.1 hypothetical protein [Acidimicrobiia bacterium]MDH5504859.1 hypothetical protein [Acidimicrobiia bacterium]
MNETDFEKRLRGHLAAKASLIEVPDHKFVQTKVVPFQPRRSRFNNLVMAAAGVAVVAMLGFGVLQVTGAGSELGIIGTKPDRCQITIMPGQEGYWLTASTTKARIGPYGADVGQTVAVEGGLPLVIEVFDSPQATDAIAENTINTPDKDCDYAVTVSEGPNGFEVDVTER